MKILFAGTPANAAKTLELLSTLPYQIVGVLTRPDAAVGRKRVITPSPVAIEAEKLGFPIIKASRVTRSVLDEVLLLKPDLAVVVAYGAILSKEALGALPKGWINLHYSVLPDWRGAAPVQHAIMAGDSETGVSLFQIDEGLDTGPVYGNVRTTISPDENSGELLQRLTVLGASLLSEQLPRIAAEIGAPVPQGQGRARAAGKISRESARVDWRQSAVAIQNLVRALNPEPVAFTLLGGLPIRILAARALSHVGPVLTQVDVTHPSVGTVLFFDRKVLVACGGTDLIELIQVQPSGKNVMAAADWYRGLSNKSTQFDLEADNG
ncbi:MAG: methionyl-tRNA formyltransferase [Micrococcales bacterium]